jgi:hypothetical protein
MDPEEILIFDHIMNDLVDGKCNNSLYSYLL